MTPSVHVRSAHPDPAGPPILIDVSHTSHSRARTGVQRVTRSLHAALGPQARAITYDPYATRWRELSRLELRSLTLSAATTKRGARWPMALRLRGRAQKLFGSVRTTLPPNAGVIVPEVFSPSVARALPSLFALSGGPCVAVFHDAIALQLPELSPPSTVARFPSYLIELLAFDGIAAVSLDSRDALRDYWRWLGITRPPPVEAIPLGIDARPDLKNGAGSPASRTPVVLCVASIEGRKNHLALLDACESLWQRGDEFSLHLVGLAQRQTGAAAVARIRALQAAGRPLRYEGAISDADVEAAYAACTFTVYPSVAEGFGLPVIESLAHGKPCICSGRGALGETARAGGCLMVDPMTSTALAEALHRLLHSPAEQAALTAAAKARRFRSWHDYGDELRSWMRDLNRPRTVR